MNKIILSIFIILSYSSVFAQWEMINSPTATPNMNKIACHPDGYIIAFTNQNEVYRSPIDNEEWVEIATLTKNITAVSICQDGIIYAGITGGYYFSNDTGATWEEKQLMPYGSITAIEFNSAGHIFMSSYAGSLFGVWISTDGGNSWNNYTIGSAGGNLIGIAKDRFENFYTVSKQGGLVYKSTNNGQNWELKTTLGTTAHNIKSDSNNVYISCINGLEGAVFRSSDFGENWVQVDSSSVRYLYADNNDNVYGVKEFRKGVIFSSDGGSSWVDFGLVGSGISDLIKINEYLYAATESGLRKSSDQGNNWQLTFAYDSYAKVNDIFISPNGKILAGTNSGLFISQNDGYNWDFTNLTSNTIMFKKNNLGDIYSASGFLYRTTNEGINWIPSDNFLAPYPNNFCINDSNHIYALEEIATVFRSTNLGNTWNIIHLIAVSGGESHGITANAGNLFFSYHIWNFSEMRLIKRDQNGNWTVVIDGMKILNIHFLNDTMYLATNSQGIYKSYNQGYDLIPINNGLSSNTVKQIILTPEVFICLAGNGIYRSLNGGDHWAYLNHSGLPSNYINRIYYSDDGILYACTNNGIYVFTGELPVELISFIWNLDGNRVTLNWSTASELNNYGFEIERSSDKTDWRIIGFREGNGTTTDPQNYTFTDDLFGVNSQKLYYRLKQIDFDGTFEYSEVVEIDIAPLTFALHQNYPNPFNPATKIKYSIPNVISTEGRNLSVTLKVYDVLGREVATLVNEEKQPGVHEVEFDASTFSSGIYLYKLNAGIFSEIKKMIYLR